MPLSYLYTDWKLILWKINMDNEHELEGTPFIVKPFSKVYASAAYPNLNQLKIKVCLSFVDNCILTFRLYAKYLMTFGI